MTNITISDRDGKPVKLATDTAPDPSGGKPIHTLKVSGASSGGGGTDVSALATEATLLALKNLVATQVEITATLWTDDSGAFYVRRDTVNETAGTVVVSWYTPTGAAATPGAGLRPTAEGKDYEITATTYAATASGTGYSNGDTIIHALMMATGPTAPTTVTSVWLNVTTNAVLSVAPSLANLASTTTLPAGASTAARQDEMRVIVDAILAGMVSLVNETRPARSGLNLLASDISDSVDLTHMPVAMRVRNGSAADIKMVIVPFEEYPPNGTITITVGAGDREIIPIFARRIKSTGSTGLAAGITDGTVEVNLFNVTG